LLAARAASGNATALLPKSVMNSRASFDHLVGERQQFSRKFYSECLGGPEIEYKLQFSRSLNRQIRGSCAF
jgi:hypothetical protein